MKTTEQNRVTPSIPRHPFADTAAREEAIRKILVGKHKSENETYTEDEVTSLIQGSSIQNIINIDTELLEKADISKGAEEAIRRECEQFKMRLDYLESVLVFNGPEPHKTDRGLIQRPWTLAVLSVKQVPKQFGQTLTVSTDIAAPLWTTTEQTSDQTKELRSTFRAGFSAYGSAESVGFFDESCTFSKPLLIQGTPCVLPSGEASFTITKFCLDTEQEIELSKARKLRIDAEVKAKAAALKEAKARKRAEAAAEKKRARASSKTKKKAPANKRGRSVKAAAATAPAE